MANPQTLRMYPFNSGSTSWAVIPLAPSITATAISSNTIRINITDNSSNETAFSLERSLTGTGGWTVVTNSIVANATSYDDTVLQPSTTYYYRMRALSPTGNSSYSNITNAVTGPASEGTLMTLTGSGFGANPNYVPVKFFDFIDVPTGTTWTGIGGSAAAFNGGQVRNDDGLPSGGGSWFDSFQTTASTGVPEYFPHYAIYLDQGVDAITCFKHVKISHFGTLTSQDAQYKSTRFMKQTGTQSAYLATPKVGSSAYAALNGNYCTRWYYEEGGTIDINVPGASSIPPLNIYNNGWHSEFSQARMNSADNVADGLHRVWWDGVYYSNWSGMDARNSTGTKFWSVQHNPGLANGYRGSGLWEVRHARIVVLKGLAWVAFGNASTFNSCTDLLVVEPKSWSDTAIQFDPHGVRPSGYNWMYVMKTDGTLVSSSGLTSFG